MHHHRFFEVEAEHEKVVVRVQYTTVGDEAGFEVRFGALFVEDGVLATLSVPRP